MISLMINLDLDLDLNLAIDYNSAHRDMIKKMNILHYP